ncbi:glutamate racemase [Aquidulcibacter sp.]|jgi:glutamate racemase|uniref:glutamate racemase n=1 Tax=Aquidulcibacter sp. TaxID=2052990 RepID=UPI0028B05A18|nr:glutamate racemase [Aquidulcibacter sp.]
MKPLKNRPHVLVFDSGLGGLSVVNALIHSRLGVDVFHLADTAFFPYGEKPDEALILRVPTVIRAGIEATSADLVIVACNTASTLALDVVRAQTQIPVVGVVPAIKPAAVLTRTGTIGLLATPKTVTRPYTDQLIAAFGAGKAVLRHGAVGLAGAAETKLAGETPDPHIFDAAIRGLFDQKGGETIDVIVLACTHYPLVQAELETLAPYPVTWVDSGAAIARRTAHLLQNQMDQGPTALRSGLTTGGADEATRRVLQGFGFQTTQTLNVESQL